MTITEKTLRKEFAKLLNGRSPWQCDEIVEKAGKLEVRCLDKLVEIVHSVKDDGYYSSNRPGMPAWVRKAANMLARWWMDDIRGRRNDM